MENRCRWLTLVVMTACALMGLCGAGLAHSAEARPNVLWFVVDDMSPDLSCYGGRSVATPNIDRLAREGRRFTDACTPSSVCSPTRYGMLTGRYCWRTSLKQQVLNVKDPLHIETNRTTVASLLQRHGYATAAIGKWHLGYGAAATVDFTVKLRPGPQDIGSDEDLDGNAPGTT